MMNILRSLVPGVAEPVTQKELSYMYYNLVNNQLIVHNTPKNHEIIVANLKELDKTPQQVAIEAKFLTIGVNDSEKKGFNWNVNSSDINDRPIPGSIQGQQPFGPLSNTVIPGSFIPPGGSADLNGDGVAETWGAEENPDGSRAGSSFSLGESAASTILGGEVGNFSGVMKFFNTMDGDSLQVAFEFLDSLEESELLSAPRVTTMNQKPAMLADFTTQYFLTDVSQDIAAGSSNGLNTTGTSVATTQTVDAFSDGIAFSVTPQISGNQVRLWMNPTVTKIVGEKEFGVPGLVINDSATSDISLTFPIYTTKSVWTNVIVIDGDTIVLGGLIEDTTFRNEERIPYVSDIPVVGYFFRGKSKSVRQKSLLIFVTPTIIDRSGARFFESDLL
jgi:type II secretory pathway component GspD/PulD (secretin)